MYICRWPEHASQVSWNLEQLNDKRHASSCCDLSLCCVATTCRPLCSDFRDTFIASFPGHPYLIHTFTGDKRGAGTDANVVITIFGEEGDSGEKKLENARNNFERAK